MKCFICDADVSNAELNDIVPLEHGNDMVYACVKHHGVIEVFEEQNNPGK